MCVSITYVGDAHKWAHTVTQVWRSDDNGGKMALSFYFSCGFRSLSSGHWRASLLKEASYLLTALLSNWSEAFPFAHKLPFAVTVLFPPLYLTYREISRREENTSSSVVEAARMVSPMPT